MDERWQDRILGNTISEGDVWLASRFGGRVDMITVSFVEFYFVHQALCLLSSYLVSGCMFLDWSILRQFRFC